MRRRRWGDAVGQGAGGWSRENQGDAHRGELLQLRHALWTFEALAGEGPDVRPIALLHQPFVDRGHRCTAPPPAAPLSPSGRPSPSHGGLCLCSERGASVAGQVNLLQTRFCTGRPRFCKGPGSPDHSGSFEWSWTQLPRLIIDAPARCSVLPCSTTPGLSHLTGCVSAANDRGVHGLCPLLNVLPWPTASLGHQADGLTGCEQTDALQLGGPHAAWRPAELLLSCSPRCVSESRTTQMCTQYNSTTAFKFTGATARTSHFMSLG